MGRRILISAKSSRLADLIPYVNEILKRLQSIVPGSIVKVP